MEELVRDQVTSGAQWPRPSRLGTPAQKAERRRSLGMRLWGRRWGKPDAPFSPNPNWVVTLQAAAQRDLSTSQVGPSAELFQKKAEVIQMGS